MSDLTTLPDDIRKKIVDINTRANQDDEFRQRLSEDPMGTLSAAGLPTDAAQTVIDFEPAQAQGEVEGYMRCVDGTCWDITYSSICPGSCWITF